MTIEQQAVYASGWLNKYSLQANEYEGWEILCPDGAIFQAANDEDLITTATRMGMELPDAWVPIDQIPEEWKDGRKLDLFGRYTTCSSTYLCRSVSWEEWESESLEFVTLTHAALPHEPPTEATP